MTSNRNTKNSNIKHKSNFTVKKERNDCDWFYIQMNNNNMI